MNLLQFMHSSFLTQQPGLEVVPCREEPERLPKRTTESAGLQARAMAPQKIKNRTCPLADKFKNTNNHYCGCV